MRRLLPLLLLVGCFESFEATGEDSPDSALLEIRLVAEAGTTGDATTARALVDAAVVGEVPLTTPPPEGLLLAQVTTSLGTHELELQLLGADGALVLRRTASVVVRGDQTYTFTLESACAAVRCAEGERCRDGRCEPEPVCPGPDCPTCDCETDADCPAASGCTSFVCRDCACVPFDDDSLCGPPAFCSDGACVADCACMGDEDCPELPALGCARPMCRECACVPVADPSRCADGEMCDPETFECVGSANLRVVLRTDYEVREFRRVRTVIDGGRPIVHVGDPDRNYVSGVTVASVEVPFGEHEVVVSLVGVSATRRQRVDVRGDTTASFLILRPTP